ncbi:MAG TPA: ornithine cyclodeaminase family protein [Gammaproteobacteria bacterium]|jgi:ornithine cyclodeaminase
MLLLNADEVSALLDRDALIEALGPAMVELSTGKVSMPPRTAALVQGQGLLGSMPAYLPSSRTLSCKLVTVFPGNAGRNLHTHQAVVMLFDADTGAPKAMLDGAVITAIRTAAGSALATRLLAREDASTLLIVGTGVQAVSHARAVARVRRLKGLRIAGREAKKAEGVAQSLGKELGVASRGYAIGSEAFHGADIVCATTHADQPVVQGAWLEPGMHVNSVGLNPAGRELDAEAVIGARVFVESRAAALAPPPSGPGDLVGATVHAEIGEVLAGTQKGRESGGQITLYKSVGVAVQDAVAAQLVYDAALARRVGTEIDL